MIQEIDVPEALARIADCEIEEQPAAPLPATPQDAAPQAPAFPPFESLAEMDATPPPPPVPIIDNVLACGDIMMLSGASKTNKSWCLLNLVLDVASGSDWWGHPCQKTKVLYVNLELTRFRIKERLDKLRSTRGDKAEVANMIVFWHLRGQARDFTFLKPELSKRMEDDCFGLIILDPVYKLLGDRNENSNGEITELLNQIAQVADQQNAAIILAHHFAKGDPSGKAAQDRMSGAGAWMRYPDSSVILTAHEEPNCFTVTSILRNHQPIEDFVMEWQYPLMQPRPDLDAGRIKRHNTSKIMPDSQFIEICLSKDGQRHKEVIAKAVAAGIKESTAEAYLRRLKQEKKVDFVAGLYSRKPDNFTLP